MDPKLLSRYEKIAEQIFGTSQTAHAELSKWVLASLLALNGGAILIFAQVVATAPKIMASTFPFLFLFGALFAVGSGVVGLKRNELVSETFFKFLIAKDDDAKNTQLKEGVERERRLVRLFNICIALSMLCLLLGALYFWMDTLATAKNVITMLH